MRLESDKQHCISDPLQDSEALLRAMIENLPGGAAFVVDPDLRYRLAAGEALSTAGFKPEDLVGSTIFEVLPPDLATNYEVLYRQALAGEPFEQEHNAHDRFYISRGTPLRSANGEVYAVLAVSYDITERRQAEADAAADLEDTQRLRELSARLVAEDDIQTLYQEIVATAIALTRADAGSVQILDEATQELVMLANQGAGQKLTEHFYRVNAGSNTPCGMALTTGKRTFIDFDVPESEDPHGSMRMHVEEGYLSAQSTPLITRSGKAIGMVSTHWRKHHRPTERELRWLDLLACQAADLIEQRQAQVALRESEERFRTLANTAPALIWYNDTQGNNLFINQHFLDFTGKSAEQIRGEGWHELVHPDEAELYIADYLAAVREQRSWHNRNRIRRHDGVWRWHENYAQPIFSADGVYLGHVGVTIDNTDAIEAEAALRESEEKFRAFVSATSDNIYEMSPDWREMRSLKGKEFVATTENPRSDWTEAYIPETDRPQVWEAINRAIATRSNFELEHRVIRLDGTVGWTFSRAIPLLNETGEIVKWFGAASNITEQKHAEEALRASEEKYRSLFQSIDEGFAVVEVMADDNGEWNDFLFLEVNPAFERHTGMVNLFGRKATEILGAPNPAWAQIYGRVAQTGEPVRFEQKEETLNRIFDLYAFRLGEAGSRRVAVLFTDITDRKRVEEQLRCAAEMDAFRVKLSDALRSLSDPIEIQAAAMRVVGEHLEADCVLYGEITPDGETIVIHDNYVRGEFPKIIGSFPARNYSTASETVRTGQTFVIREVSAESSLGEAEKAAFTQLSIVAILAIPFVKAGRWVSTLGVYQGAVRNWTAHDIAMVQETVERTWDAVERARAERELRESEIQRVREQAAREEERQRAEALAELDRAKTLFFSNVSHEFRTPLTLILAPLQDALNDGTLPPSHREQLDLAHRNALRLLKLVNTLLDFSRIEAGRMEAVYEPTDLAQFTTELASVFRSAIDRAGLRLIVDCPPLPEPVYVDREMWEKIVLNLLSNAFKFTFAGEITVSLRAESNTEPQASPANVHGLCSELKTPTSELETSSSEPETLSLELGTSTLKLDTSSSEADTSTSELETPTSELETSSLEADTSTLELKTTPFLRNALQTEKPATTSRPHVVLEICDTGTGIAHEHLPHLFERFYQIRGTQARTHEGSGIGLALAHELVQLHGGTINVSSTVGAGTCFTIAIPFGTEHLPSDRLHLEGDRPTCTQASTVVGAAPYLEEAERWLPISDPLHPPLLRGENSGKVPLFKGDLGGSPELNHPTLASARVLLVDDNADMRDYLTRILSEQVQVEAVADGAAALAAAQAQVPDLILSDVMMPGLDGFGLLQALRADPRTREVPIILLSARAGEEAVVEGMEAGADDYLIKPFSAQELVTRVNAHLQMAKLRGAALQQERTLSRRKDELLSTVSHELNTPLVAILGWTRLLRANPASPSMLTKALNTIERNATIQAKLVQDLLDISRIITGKLRLSLQPVELKSVIEAAIATVAQTAAAKDIDLVWPETAAVVVLGDSDRLQQVICNLLTNAIKFTPESGSVTVDLSVDNNPHPPYAQIRVTDTGIGILADFLPHVFERFCQAADTDAAKGLGLGLAITQHLVELHNGTIQAQSAGEGQGATFIVRLPLLASAGASS